jgi:hypothetical protein
MQVISPFWKTIATINALLVIPVLLFLGFGASISWAATCAAVSAMYAIGAGGAFFYKAAWQTRALAIAAGCYALFCIIAATA